LGGQVPHHHQYTSLSFTHHRPLNRAPPPPKWCWLLLPGDTTQQLRPLIFEQDLRPSAKETPNVLHLIPVEPDGWLKSSGTTEVALSDIFSWQSSIIPSAAREIVPPPLLRGGLDTMGDCLVSQGHHSLHCSISTMQIWVQ
jgi:hypothetical protein